MAQHSLVYVSKTLSRNKVGRNSPILDNKRIVRFSACPKTDRVDLSGIKARVDLERLQSINTSISCFRPFIFLCYRQAYARSRLAIQTKQPSLVSK